MEGKSTCCMKKGEPEHLYSHGKCCTCCHDHNSDKALALIHADVED